MALDDERAGRRRRFALALSPLADALPALGLTLGGDDGLVGVLGIVAAAQGIGLAIAVGILAFGHNPLQRRGGGRGE